MITHPEDFTAITFSVIDGWGDIFYSAFEWCELIQGGYHRFFFNLVSDPSEGWTEYYRGYYR